MKKISLLFYCALTIISDINSMKHSHDELIISPTAADLINYYVPTEIITTIAALCNAKTRTSLSAVNKRLNQCASIKNNEAIIDHAEFTMKSKYRLYYLFYGCMHNCKKLVTHTLRYFDLEDDDDKAELSYAEHFIRQLTDADVTKILPYFPDIAIEPEGKNILYLPIENCDKALFALLLKQPTCKVNEKSEWKFGEKVPALLQIIHELIYHTPCNTDRFNNYMTMVKLLLAHPDIDVNVQDADGNTPLHRIQQNSSRTKARNILKLLLDHPNINVNIQNNKGNTPLHTRIGYNQNCYLFSSPNALPIKALLAHHTININAQNNKGDTPLHVAIRNLEIEVIQLLLAHSDIDVTISNEDGLTPLCLAKSLQQEQVRVISLYNNVPFRLKIIENNCFMSEEEHTQKSNAIVELLSAGHNAMQR